MSDPRADQATLAQAYNQTVSLHEQGRLVEAEAGYRRILTAIPDQADSLHLLGLLLIQTGRVEPGLAMVDRSLVLAPKLVDAHFNRAAALLQLGRFDAAVEGFDNTLALAPTHLAALYSRSLALAQAGRFEAALMAFDAVLAVQPGHIDALMNRAVTLDKLGRAAEALSAFDAVLALQPDDADAEFGRGGALKALGRLEEAHASFAKVLALRPGWPSALVNRGVVLKLLGRPRDATADYDRALAAAPGHVEALISRGAALVDLGRLDEAMRDYDAALQGDRGNPLAVLNRSLVMLATGRFEEGWPRYERRRDLLAPAAPPFRPWDGQAELKDRSLFLRWEQGLGDTLQFYRYAKLAADRGARVTLSSQAALRPFFEGQDRRIVIVGPDETPSQADVYADLMSLAGLFGTTTSTVPLADGYLAADPASQAAWSQRLGDRVKPRIGLVWSGAAGHANDRNRSASLAALAPLFAFDADWFVLQKDIRPADRETLAGLTSVTLIEEAVADFEQTAALIANLDLVIAVDTSIAHLAAAMGKPTWILLSTACDWRWLLEREDSPWYASARLFRQAVAHDWSELAERVRAELARRFA